MSRMSFCAARGVGEGARRRRERRGGRERFGKRFGSRLDFSVSLFPRARRSTRRDGISPRVASGRARARRTLTIAARSSSVSLLAFSTFGPFAVGS
eukprot:30959-Pelagococcus_subviridis.AAC.12